jgi:SAM-dependent methyltransferase
MSLRMKDVVRQGYDRVSRAYRSDVGENAQEYAAWLRELAPLLEPGAPVLDLGCGCGIPVARDLATWFRVTGVDVSEVQIERARSLVPQAEFLCADMTQVDFAPGSFAAVVAFYSIIHVPLEEQPDLLRKVRRWLRPGGYFMATVGHTAWTGTEDNWLVSGATMFWSHTDAPTYHRWLAESGFSVLWSRFVPEGNSGHTLLLARSNASRST